MLPGFSTAALKAAYGGLLLLRLVLKFRLPPTGAVAKKQASAASRVGGLVMKKSVGFVTGKVAFLWSQ